MFLGFDCSTQSLTALIIDQERGTVEYEESVNYEKELSHYQTHHGFVRGTEPDEFFSYPLMWVEALDKLCQKLVDAGAQLDKITAISGSAQQHSIVFLARNFEERLLRLNPSKNLHSQLEDCLTRPVSPIWMDSSTTEECIEIAKTIGSTVKEGQKMSVENTGSPLIHRFSASQIRKYSKQYPERWNETHKIHLVSSFMSSLLAGRRSPIDYGDGAGMNLMQLKSCNWDATMLSATGPNLFEKLPALQPSSNMAGKISPYFVERYGFHPDTDCVLWSGDNVCSLVGMGASRPGKWVMSLGTSYTLFSASEKPKRDPLGYGHVFANPIKGWMSLNCFKNGALACLRLAEQRGLDREAFEKEARIPPTADHSPAVPFYETEITPPHHPVSWSNFTVRSLLDGQFLNMRLHSLWQGETPSSIYLTGGASKSDGIAQTVSNIFNTTVCRMHTSNSAALGAAMRAGHALGHDLDDLESKFCTVIDKIHQEPDIARIYDDLLIKFAEKL